MQELIWRLKDGVPYVLELNPNPDIASDVPEDTGFTRSAKAHGWEYSYLDPADNWFCIKEVGSFVNYGLRIAV